MKVRELSVADQTDLMLRSGLGTFHNLLQLAGTVDLASGKRKDHVTRLEASLFGRRVAKDLGDENATTPDEQFQPMPGSPVQLTFTVTMTTK